MANYITKCCIYHAKEIDTLISIASVIFTMSFAAIYFLCQFINNNFVCLNSCCAHEIRQWCFKVSVGRRDKNIFLGGDFDIDDSKNCPERISKKQYVKHAPNSTQTNQSGISYHIVDICIWQSNYLFMDLNGI